MSVYSFVCFEAKNLEIMWNILSSSNANRHFLNEVYEVVEEDITLKIEIGYGQNAASIVYLDGKRIEGPLNEGAFERSFEVNLGKIRSGQKLTVSTTVLDIMPETDKTSVTVSLLGGKSDIEFPVLTFDAQEFITIPYYIRILFYKTNL